MPRKSERLIFLDNLKIFLICIVVIHHAGQAYGPTGGFWYYSSKESISWLGRFFLLNASYFMGLFFFISGYFLTGSFDRNGSFKFIKDRLVRLGIPVLIALFILLPYEMYMYHIMKGDSVNFISYYIHTYLGIGQTLHGLAKSPFTPELNFGHLWYAEHLLIYALIYAGFRNIFCRHKIERKSHPFPALWKILLFVVLLGIATDVIRNNMGFKIDKWVIFLGFIAAEVAHLPQYISFFILGIISYNKKWLDTIPVGRCLIIFGLGVLTVLYYWIGRDFIGKKVWEHWELKESIIAVGFSLGLLVVFKTWFNTAGNLMKKASSSAFAAYVVHVPVLVSFQVLFHYIQCPAVVKFAAVSVIGILLSFFAGYRLKQLPLLKKVF